MFSYIENADINNQCKFQISTVIIIILFLFCCDLTNVQPNLVHFSTKKDTEFEILKTL